MNLCDYYINNVEMYLSSVVILNTNVRESSIRSFYYFFSGVKAFDPGSKRVMVKVNLRPLKVDADMEIDGEYYVTSISYVAHTLMVSLV
jgi:hypothetical protein